MKKSALTLEQRYEKFIRVFSIVGILVLAYRIFADIKLFGFNRNLPPLSFPLEVYVVMNSLCILSFAFLIWKPYKLEVMASITFLYSIIVFEDYPVNPICVLLFLIGLVSLYTRGLFVKNKKKKLIIAGITLVVLQLSRLRFGTESFINSLRENAAYLLVDVVIITLLYGKNKIDLHRASYNNKLDLSQFTELNERDKEWIRLALLDTKYSVIARESGVSVGTVKNRMHAIYKILGVADRISLLVEYGGCEVIE